MVLVDENGFGALLEVGGWKRGLRVKDDDKHSDHYHRHHHDNKSTAV